MKTATAPKQYLAQVKEQYEDLPYPERNPEDEKWRLNNPFLEALDHLNFYCYEGRNTFTDNFRALVAGGGTGDSTIFLAEQLRHTNAEIVYLDLSRASMQIAQKRAEIRGLKNIQWVHASLLDIPSLNLGAFDHINCSGVLHHLESPEAGLCVLASVLKENGAMALMVYGQYGRTGVYQLQEMLRHLTANAQSKPEKISIARQAIASLPPCNWFQHNRGLFNFEITTGGDAGLYDLLLHPQDRAYTVPQLYELVENCGLKLIDFLMPGGIGKATYNPLSFTQNQALIQAVSTLDMRSRQAVAELMAGTLMMHHFYVGKRIPPKPRADEPDNIPFFWAWVTEEVRREILKGLENALPGEQVLLRNGPRNNAHYISPGPYTAKMAQLIDSARTVGEILDTVRQEYALEDSSATREGLMQEWLKLYEVLNGHDWVLLRHKSVPRFPWAEELQARWKQALS